MPGKTVQRASCETAETGDALDGAAVEDLDARTARQAGLPAGTRGVVMTEVDPGSAAASAGLKEGDVIQEVNRHAVSNSHDLSSALHKSRGESLLLMNRGGNKLYLAV